MIDIIGQIPRKVSIAFSGGVDSVAIHDFLSKNHEVDILYFHHGETDKTANQCAEFAQRTADRYNQKIFYSQPSRGKNDNESMEEYWRNMRYEWFHTMEDRFIIVCHHLNDCVETWVWSALNGTPRVIPYRRGKNVFRPFLTTRKSEFESWAERKQLAYMVDPTNLKNDKTRNYIRNVMMPHCYHVNPGLDKVVKRKIQEQSSNFYNLDDMDFENIYVK